MFILNDLSIDREKYKKEVRSIYNSSWKVDNRGIVYNSRGTPASLDITQYGNVRVRVPFGTQVRWVYVNRLVLDAFGETPPPPDHVPFHRDGDRLNCSAVNLTWVSRDSSSSVDLQEEIRA